MIIIFLLLIGVSSAALPKCSSEGCPAGGIWSEWVTSETCATSCGSCSTQYYTRKCLSTSANCTCSGDTSRYSLCNTQTCLYPAQRTCCIPYVSMLINGSFQCGPFPKSTETTSSCCPPSGLWSAWSKYGRNDAGTSWVRSRSCVSEEAGCPCVGDTTQTNSTCPCRAMIDVTDVITVNTSNKVYPINATIDNAACTYTGWLVSVGGTGSLPCNRFNFTYTDSATIIYSHVSVIRYTVPSAPNVRVDLRTFDCQSADIVTPTNQNKVTFHCDMEALYWQLDYNNAYVNGWAQLNI